MHPCPGNWVAIVCAVVYYARADKAFSAGIKCRYCTCYMLFYHAFYRSDYNMVLGQYARGEVGANDPRRIVPKSIKTVSVEFDQINSYILKLGSKMAPFYCCAMMLPT